MVNSISWDTHCCDRCLTEVHQDWFHQLRESSGPLYHSSADVCVLCVVGKKPTSRRKVVDRTSVHDVKSLVTHFTTAPPEVSGCSSFWHLTGFCCFSGIGLQLNYQPAPDMKTGLSPSTVSRGSRNLLFLVKYSPSQKVFDLTQAFWRAGVNHRIHTLYDLGVNIVSLFPWQLNITVDGDIPK